MSRLISIFALLLSCCVTAPVTAEQSKCLNIYANNERPPVSGIEICFDRFAVVYSPETKTAVVSAERLTPEMIIGAEGIQRVNAFHAEPSIRNGPTPSDYSRSGYDRGHMTPAGDMPTPVSQRQTFSMVNMTPQTPELNRIVWSNLERRVRTVAKTHELFVVTGAVYPSQPATIGRGVAVPIVVYKAIYGPDTGHCEFYAATNEAEPEFSVLTKQQFVMKYGIHPFEEDLCD